MNDIETIDQFFSGAVSDLEKKEFEQRILQDPDFANSVAFYVSAMQSLEEHKEQYRKKKLEQLYQQYHTHTKQGLVYLLSRPLAIAAGIIAILAVLLLLKLYSSSDPSRLADDYVQKHWSVLPVTMNVEQDKLQYSLQLYNEKDYAQCATELDGLLQEQPGNPEALKYSGIVQFQLQQYEVAEEQFSQLAEDKSLRINPGLFFKALVLMKRNAPGDWDKARMHLEEVKDGKQAGAAEAIEWLELRH